MRLFYFTRHARPSPFDRKFLVSGVVQAEDMKAACQQLTTILRDAGSRYDGYDFTFIALDEVKDAKHGVLAVTMGEG